MEGQIFFLFHVAVTSRNTASVAVETEEERRARLENDALPNGSGWPWRRTKNLEKMVPHSSLMLALIKGMVDVGVVFVVKTILKSWKLCLSFKIDVLTT